MQKTIVATLLYVSLFCIFFCLLATETYSAATSPLVIKEIMADPVGDDSLYEWIEVQNISASALQLSNYKINNIKLATAIVGPNETIILAKNPSYLLSRYPDLTAKIYSITTSLANSGGTLNLTDNSDNTLNTFVYGQSQEGKTYQLLEGSCNLISITTNTEGHTIGEANESCISPTVTVLPTSITTPTITPVLYTKYSNLLEIVQVKPCGTDEYLIIKSSDTYQIDLSGWRLEIDDKKQIGLNENYINSKSLLTISMNYDFMSDSGGRIALIDPSGNQKDVFSYTKCADDKNSYSIKISSENVDSQETITVEKVQALKYPKLYID